MIAFWLEAWLIEGRDPVALSVERLFRRQRLWPDAPPRSIISTARPRTCRSARRRCSRGWSRRRRGSRRPAICEGARDARRSWSSRRWSMPGSSTKDAGRRRPPGAASVAPSARAAARRHLFRRLGAARGARPGRRDRDRDDRRDDARPPAAARRRTRGRARAGLRQAQIALVAMRPDGRVVAMVGGKNYADSPFNRATQARRQPGSAFKLFVYLAAMRAGMTPDSMIDDKPVDDRRLEARRTADGRYRGRDHAAPGVRALVQRRGGAADPAGRRARR